MTGYVQRHFVRSGPEFEVFWREYLKTERRILFVLGLGFDPRSLECLEKIKACNTESAIEYRILEYDYCRQPSDIKEMCENNRTGLEAMGLQEAQKATIRMQGDEHMTSTDALKSITKEDLCTHSDIVVDVTSMPVGAYFPMIRNVLSMIKSQDKGGQKTNLHITVSENSRMDTSIFEITNSEKSSHMHKFSTSLEKETKHGVKAVWIPVLANNQNDQFNKIKLQLDPAETVPMLPMPSANPYESRDIILEYSSLFDSLRIEQRNIAYSSERNPSETCAKITAIARDYERLYDTIGGCIITLSPLANKLRCIGCLMAACALLDDGVDLAVEYVPNQSYGVEGGFTQNPGTLYTIWLAGECYE